MSESRRGASLQLAVDEKGAAVKAAGLRDRLIAHALAEGESVTEIATALELSEPTVFKVKEALNREHNQGSAELIATAERLEAFTDHVRFEDLVAVLMDDIEPGSIPLGGVADRGRDGTNLNRSAVWTISLAQQWTRKIRSDLKRITEEGFKPKRVYAVTNRRTTTTASERIEAEADEQGIDLTILNQRWLVAKLTHPDYLHLREEHLGLTRPHARAFLPAADYRGLLDGRPHLFGFDTAFVGREREIEEVEEVLKRQGCVLLTGSGGLGKTRLALQMAEREPGPWYFLGDAVAFSPDAISELLITAETTVVIDNAHRRNDLSQVAAALGDLEHRPRLILIARPGFAKKINQDLSGSWVGAFSRDETIELDGLSWEEMGKLLQTPSLDVRSEGMRGTLIALAEGNPQIAVIGATVARERKSIAELSSSDLLQAYVIYLIPSALPPGVDLRPIRRLLAVAAALGGIDEADEDLLTEVADISRESTHQLKDRLEYLADGGLFIREGNTYKIKPDLLSEHVLFALTLSQKWERALPYGQIFERFGERYLHRLIAALGELPTGLIDEGARAQLRPVERALDRVLLTEDATLEAAQLLRDIARAFPEIAYPRCLELLANLSEADEPLPTRTLEVLGEAALRIANFELRWKLLLRLAAATAEAPELVEKVGESMAAVYEYLPDDGSKEAGRVLAWVQHTLAEQTERFWARRSKGAAVAVALAIEPMLTLIFDVSRQSADNPMAITLGARILPYSKYTRGVVFAGARLAAEVFEQLDPPRRLKLLETLSSANHGASGYSISHGARLDIWARRLLDQALSQVDEALADRLAELPMPVAAEAYSYLLKRAKTRELLLEDLEEESEEEKLSSRSAPIPSEALEQYVFLIHQGEVGPPELSSLEEEQERMDAQSTAVAEALLAGADWRQTLDRWTQWCVETREARGELHLGPAPAMVLRDLSRRDPALGREVIDHLVATGSELRSASAGAMAEIFEVEGEDAVKTWLEADAMTKAALASALAGNKRDSARGAMREMVLSEEEETRDAAMQSLVFARNLSKWDIDLALEALVKAPSIEALSRLLHMADHHAKAKGKDGHSFDPEQVDKIERAVLGTASSERLGEYRLADLLERAARQLPRLPIDWALARLEFLHGLDRKEKRLRLWRFVDELPEEIQDLVKEAAGQEDLGRAIDLFSSFGSDSYALGDTATLIGWIDPAADAVTDLIVDLLGKKGRSYSARSNLMRLKLSEEQLDRRAQRIAESLDNPLGPLVDLLEGTLPMFWSGSRLPYLETALGHAKRWSQSGDPDLRAAGQQTASHFEQSITKERRDEKAEDRRFEYG